MKRRDKFDRILVETTGLADPGPVAQTFFMDEDVQREFRLDGIVTLIDAKHLDLHFEDSKEVREQVAFADVLVLNKMDLVSSSQVDALERRLRAMNALARIFRSRKADVPIADVLNIGGFDLKRAVERKPTFLQPGYPFEWACVVRAREDLRLVLRDGPEAGTSLVILALDVGDEAELDAAAERVSRIFSRLARRLEAGGDLVPGERRYQIRLGERGNTAFTLRVPKPGFYAVFTQHTPGKSSLVFEERTGRPVRVALSKSYVAGHVLGDEITSVGIEMEGKVDVVRFNEWLEAILHDHGADIFRSKGILDVAGEDARLVFQAVHMLVDQSTDRRWGRGRRLNQLCFIGRNLDRQALTSGFKACLV